MVNNSLTDRVEAGWALQRKGLMAEAEEIYRAVLGEQPDCAQAWHNLALIAIQARNADAAIASLTRAIAIDPLQERYHNNLAHALRSAGRHAEALVAADRAIALRADFAGAIQCRGMARQALSDHAAALDDFDQTIALGFMLAESFFLRGQSLVALDRSEEALASFDAALREQPTHALALNARGQLYANRRLQALALADFDAAVRLLPLFAEALNNRGTVRFQLGRMSEALADCDASIRIRKDQPRFWNNRGNIQVALGRLDAALLDYDRAIALQSDYPDPYVNKGIALLQFGNFDHGWFYFEWRWKRDAVQGHRVFSQPLWLGQEDIAGRTIFLHSEQGLGDTLQFFRYAAVLRDKGAKVLLGVQPALAALIAHALPDVAVYAEGQVIPPFTLQCPLMSLPLACATQVQTIPPSPRLAAPEAQRATWAARLGARNRLRVGLVWQGNPDHMNDHNRSLPLAALAPWRRLDVEFVCLQKVIPPADRAVLESWGVANFAEELVDFTATAALIETVDLVIAVDTSLAHLAGAMGKPVWLMLPYNPDFRWLLGRDDSPWYPSMRIFRQAAPGGWPEVIAAVGDALAAVQPA